jgi:NADH-quinone oxidoreductase subunit E
MSVRRLAEPSVQPPAFAFSPSNEVEVKRWIDKYPKGREQSAVIPLLMIAQDQDGWVTKAAIEHVADMLHMPYIRALEVATFYTQFQLKPVGTRAHVQVCGTTPCMLRGAEALMDVCREKIHHDQFHTNDNGTLSWEEIECAGACVNAPMVMIFSDTYEDLTPERLGEIIDAFAAGKGAGVPAGPQVDRIVSAPQSGLTTLRDEKAILKSTRDEELLAEAQAAAAAAPATPEPAATAAPAVMPPPSNAAKLKTDAPETSAAVKSPSEVKVAPAAEAANAPKLDAANANKAAEPTDKTAQQPSAGAPAAIAGIPAGTARAPAPAKPALTDPNRPAGVERPGKPDDLKLVSGVGPKIEGILNSLGIFTFAQVASWQKAERDWVDGYLNFKGRIDRDDWVKQAEALARGGVAEYIRVFGKKPV